METQNTIINNSAFCKLNERAMFQKSQCFTKFRDGIIMFKNIY